jgi:AcrR family transcriptional regulator
MAPTPAQSRAEDPRPARTREAVLAAATRLLDESPDEVPTMQAIAQAAGVSRTSLYKQFPDLTSLAMQLMDRTFADLGRDDLHRRGAPGAHPDLSARTAVRGFVDYLHRHRAFYRSSLEWQVTSRVHEAIVNSYADRIRASARLIRDAPTGDDLEDQALFIAGGVIGRVTAWIRDDDPALSDPDLAEQTTTRLIALMPAWLVGA